MAKYSVGQHIVSVDGKRSVYRVVMVSLDLYSLRVVSSTHLCVGSIRSFPKRLVEDHTKPLLVEDNV